ncbi:MAG: hypothetical protein ACRCYX_04305 [Dermatophilaceae bacterium]
MTFRAPPPLAAGDTVVVLAPAGAVVESREQVRRGMAVLRSPGTPAGGASTARS